MVYSSLIFIYLNCFINFLEMCHYSNFYCKSTHGLSINCMVPEFLNSFFHCIFQKIIINFSQSLMMVGNGTS